MINGQNFLNEFGKLNLFSVGIADDDDDIYKTFTRR